MNDMTHTDRRQLALVRDRDDRQLASDQVHEALYEMLVEDLDDRETQVVERQAA